MKGKKYSIKEAKGNNHYKIMIVDETLKNFSNKNLFPWLLLITIDVENKTGPYNLPTDYESKILNSIEDYFNKLISFVTTYQFVGRITGDGTRKLYYYIENPQIIHQKLTDIIQDGNYLRGFEYSISKDIEWERVRFLFE